MPPKAKEFMLLSSQVTAFIRDVSFQPERLIFKLGEEWLDRYDGQTETFPQIAPAQLPRVQYRSKSGEWRASLFVNRIDFHWTERQDATPHGDVGKVVTDLYDMCEVTLKALDVRPHRLALVNRWFAFQDVPAVALADVFCHPDIRTGAINEPSGFEIHALKKYRMGELFDVNSWVRNRTGEVTFENKKSPIVLVEQDLNMRVEPGVFDEHDLATSTNFFELAKVESLGILNKYYPE